MEIPSPDKVENVCNWVELVISCKGYKLSQTQLSKQIEGDKGDEPEESFISSVWTELRRRESEYQTPPFKVESNIIRSTISWKDIPSYIVCLFFSVYGGSNNFSKSAKLFERITSETLQKYCGLETEIFGWPINRTAPKSIKDRVNNLAEKLHEECIKSPSSKKKDDTLDVVAWKPFHDRKPSQLVILVQCATGANWITKSNELRLEAWKKYIHWACKPVRGFAVPYIVDPPQWSELSLDGMLIIDRIRIYNILKESGENEAFRKELIRWCEKKIPKYLN